MNQRIGKEKNNKISENIIINYQNKNNHDIDITVLLVNS